MDEKEFRSLMLQVIKGCSGNWDYCSGYIFGLRHLFYGGTFGTEMERDLLQIMLNHNNADGAGTALRQGCRDGYNGLTPSAERWGYCTENDHDCGTRHIVYGRECSNNPAYAHFFRVGNQ